ncbi:ABC transporter permease [Kribbella sp. GL6]|uniref:ABC transporter permease n=1 Tax=Kribbella sp. GL6 TaxID=3419765 RepID=UPI003D0039FE
MTQVTAPPAAAAVEPAAVPRRFRGAGRPGYFLRRIGFSLITTLIAITLNFAIPRFMPGDPAGAVIRQIQLTTGAPPSGAEMAAIRAFYGDPTSNLVGDYLDYWGALIHFDFGVSVTHYPVPVADMVLQALPWTLLLIGSTTFLAWLVGTLAGAYLGWRPGNTLDSVALPLSTFASSLPMFWFGLVVLWIFGMRLGWFPISGAYDPDVPFAINNIWFLLSVTRYGALPAAVLVLLGLNGWLFSMRNVMVTTVTEDYVLLARAKGLSAPRVLLGYAARNALLPNVTGLAMAIGGVIGGAILVETVFTYPGMGLLLQQAITGHDFPVMQTVLLMLTIIMIVANLVADLTYGLLDPRTREVR